MVVLASLLEAKGIPYEIKASLDHIWVEYPQKQDTRIENDAIAVMQNGAIQVPRRWDWQEAYRIEKAYYWDAMPDIRKVLLFAGLLLIACSPWITTGMTALGHWLARYRRNAVCATNRAVPAEHSFEIRRHIMSGNSQTTTDRKTIQKWVEERGGRSVSVKSTGGKDDPGLLRIDFPDADDNEPFEEISWDDFFEKFEEKKLAFVYQDTTTDGEQSYFNKLVNRD